LLHNKSFSESGHLQRHKRRYIATKDRISVLSVG